MLPCSWISTRFLPHSFILSNQCILIILLTIHESAVALIYRSSFLASVHCMRVNPRLKVSFLVSILGTILTMYVSYNTYIRSRLLPSGVGRDQEFLFELTHKIIHKYSLSGKYLGIQQCYNSRVIASQSVSKSSDVIAYFSHLIKFEQDLTLLRLRLGMVWDYINVIWVINVVKNKPKSCLKTNLLWYSRGKWKSSGLKPAEKWIQI